MYWIHLCFEYKRDDFTHWLQSNYEISSSLPKNSYNLLIFDAVSLNRVADHELYLKNSNPIVFMPAVMVSKKEELNDLKERLKGVADKLHTY